jgi:hypothetical protein
MALIEHVPGWSDGNAVQDYSFKCEFIDIQTQRGGPFGRCIVAFNDELCLNYCLVL